MKLPPLWLWLAVLAVAACRTTSLDVQHGFASKRAFTRQARPGRSVAPLDAEDAHRVFEQQHAAPPTAPGMSAGFMGPGR